MCGRYTLTCSDHRDLLGSLPFEEINDVRIQLRPRYNVAPGQRNPVMHVDDRGVVLDDATWGFERPSGGLAINARSETAKRTAMFRDSFRQGRCLIPADGFFEWRREGRVNQPYLFRRPDGGPFVMAGLRRDGRYVVLTRDASGEVADIHDRMPVILEAEQARHWLDEGVLGEPPSLRRIPVSTRVNRIDHDDPECLQEVSQQSFKF